jgi:hypothetical protein
MKRTGKRGVTGCGVEIDAWWLGWGEMDWEKGVRGRLRGEINALY